MNCEITPNSYPFLQATVISKHHIEFNINYCSHPSNKLTTQVKLTNSILNLDASYLLITCYPYNGSPKILQLQNGQNSNLISV